MVRRVLCAAMLAGLLSWAPAQAGVGISADFNDGTYGDLDTLVNVSDTSINTTVTWGASADNVPGGTDPDYGLPDTDNEFYNSGGGGAGLGYSGGDQALIDTDNTFSDVVATGVVGLTTVDTRYGSEGAGLVAGMAAGGGSGYLLYLADSWYNGDGYFVDSPNQGGLLQLILTRKEAANSTPLNGATLYDTNTITETDAANYSDQPQFLRLTVAGTTVTGEVWLNQADDTGAADATVSFTDPSVLSGHVGVYLAIGHYGSSPPNYRTNYGVAAVDDFQVIVSDEAPIPEPAGLGLLGPGVLGLMRRRRR